MTATTVALLRGVNVGGRSTVTMDDLRRIFLDMGHRDVRTYIQSGNVLFTPGRRAGRSAIERRLRQELGTDVTVVLRTPAELEGAVAANPYGDAGTKDLYVTFLVEDPDPARVAALTVPAHSTDTLAVRGREVYVHCPGGYGRTKLNNTFVERQLGVGATTRNWRTVTKLIELAGR